MVAEGAAGVRFSECGTRRSTPGCDAGPESGGRIWASVAISV